MTAPNGGAVCLTKCKRTGDRLHEVYGVLSDNRTPAERLGKAQDHHTCGSVTVGV